MAKGFGSRGIPGMGGGMNMNMIKQAQKMQQDMLKMQQELEEKTYEASAGGGVVTASVSGKRELKSLTIDPDAVDPDDVEMLEDMIVAAVNEALRAAESDAASNMQKLTGGLGLPSGATPTLQNPGWEGSPPWDFPSAHRRGSGRLENRAQAGASARLSRHRGSEQCPSSTGA